MRRSQHTGFTLIELLVALMIVGIALGAVSFAIGNGGEQRQLREEVIKVQRWLEQMQRSAVVGSKILAMDFQEDNQLLPLQYREQRWKINELAISNYSVNERIRITAVSEKPDTIDENIPVSAIVFFPDGEITPFELRFGFADELVYMLSNQANSAEIIMEEIL